MHVVTFYSFKGGVGRTLALTNVGVELARTGRKVLLVDFDLEAPGLDTFVPLAPPKPSRGLVDYICTYESSGDPPGLDGYCYEVDSIKDSAGRLWIMPSGRRDAEYGRKLTRINWHALYELRHGYLLFEHLKSLWTEQLDADYVLIDSRTGHTEVGGICTRQLPDTVVALFIPNEQNLEGISHVIDAIHRENEENDRSINIELVASNVPTLDDEEQILRRMLSRFERRLQRSQDKQGGRRIHVIERYDSLHLLNQSIFVLDRPRSRLAKQYRQLLRRIIRHNLEDREAAIEVISRPHGIWGDREPTISVFSRFRDHASDDFDQVVQRVLRFHDSDAKICQSVGERYKQRGDLEKAELFFDRAARLAKEQGLSSRVEYVLEWLDLRIQQGETDAAREELIRLLDEPLVSGDARNVLALLMRTGDSPDSRWAQCPAIQAISLDDLDSLAWEACTSRDWQKFILALRKSRVSDLLAYETESLDVDVILMAIGAGDFDLVLRAYDETALLENGEIQDCFNYAMAKWGKTREPDRWLFHRVIELDEAAEEDVRLAAANYEQCLALAHAVVGAADSALQRLQEAESRVGKIFPDEFSCWSYLAVSELVFRHDLEELKEFICGKSLLPRFIK